jgi:hypothetical protein
MCRGGLAHNAVRAAACERNGKRSGKGETEGSGPGPSTITCDASWRHKRQIIYASQRNDAYASKPGRYCPHASTDYPRLKLGKTLIDVLKKS